MRSAIFFALFLVTSLSIGVHAQNYGQEPLKRSKITIDITDQPGCPLKLAADTPTFGPRFSVKLLNTDDKLIEGFVLVEIADGVQGLQADVRPVRTNDKSEIVFKDDKIGEGKYLFSVDYVQFADGSTWGSDEFGRSEYVKGYLTGRNLAIARLKDMLGGVIPEDIQKALGDLGLHWISESPEYRSSSLSTETLNGYREVVNTLRHPTTSRTKEAQELARKLELMENTLG